MCIFKNQLAFPVKDSILKASICFCFFLKPHKNDSQRIFFKHKTYQNEKDRKYFSSSKMLDAAKEKASQLGSIGDPSDFTTEPPKRPGNWQH